LGEIFAKISIPNNGKKKTLVAKDLSSMTLSLSLFVPLKVIDRRNSSCCSSNQSGSLQGRRV
jgi:hypothetical protein